MNSNNFTGVIGELYKEGFSSGAPSEVSARIGIGVCSRAYCLRCGKEGTEYRPFYHEVTTQYRAFAVCAGCGAYDEF